MHLSSEWSSESPVLFFVFVCNNTDPCIPDSGTAKIGMTPLSGLYLTVILIMTMRRKFQDTKKQGLIRAILPSRHFLTKNMLNHIHILSVLLPALLQRWELHSPQPTSWAWSGQWGLGSKGRRKEKFWPLLLPPIRQKLWVSVISILISSETHTVLTSRLVFLFPFKSLNGKFPPIFL